MIQAARLILVACNEATAINNHNDICIHVYVMLNYSCISLRLQLQKLEHDGAFASDLTTMIMNAMTVKGCLTLWSKLLNQSILGAHSASTFQGLQSGVSKQIIHNFYTLQHCRGQKLNLAVKKMGVLLLVVSIANVMKATNAFYSQSPKRMAEFFKLANLYILQEMLCIMPLLKAAYNLMQFAQIKDFVGIFLRCQGNVYKMYVDYG